MSISQKVQAIEEVYSLLDQEMSNFHGWSKLTCKTGCGKCCHKPNIEASVLELLPFAEHIYHANQSEEWLAKLRQHEGPLCIFFDAARPGAGFCTQYKFRALICRLFGFSARTNKYSQKEFVTCQTIKTEQAEEHSATVKTIENGGDVPVINHYYMRVAGIDPDLARDFYPINEAMRRAIETVLHYYAYRT
ncbi:MAG: YkgJ family cysteine cluster protein [Chryseosolibacter sp.]